MNLLEQFSRSKFLSNSITSNPITLVDVGARGGVSSEWHLFGKNLRVLGFEPDSKECKRLNSETESNHIYFPTALYNKQGKVNINLTQEPACTSMYLPNFSLVNRFANFGEMFNVIDSVEVCCDTLDRIAKANNIQDIDFLKIDTQGTELQILEGAKNVLENYVFGLKVEVEFSPLYKKQPLFSEVDEYLRKFGFYLFDINPRRMGRKKYGFCSKQQALWAYALYFKDIILTKNINQKYLNFEKAIKTIAIAEFQGFLDFALELLDFYYNKKIITKENHEKIKHLLLKNRLLKEYQLLREMRSSAGNYLKAKHSCFYNLYEKISKLKS